MTIYYVGDSAATTWPVGEYYTIGQAAEAHNLRSWRLTEAGSAEEAYKLRGHIVRGAQAAVDAEKRYMAQQAGRIGGKAGVGVAKIRAGFAESLRKARAARAARILAKSAAEQHPECPMCHGTGYMYYESLDRTTTCECCNGSGRADA